MTAPNPEDAFHHQPVWSRATLARIGDAVIAIPNKPQPVPTHHLAPASRCAEARDEWSPMSERSRS